MEQELYDDIFDCICNRLDRYELLELNNWISEETGSVDEVYELEEDFFDDVCEGSSPYEIARYLSNSHNFNINDAYFREVNDGFESTNDLREWIDVFALTDIVYNSRYPFECEALESIFKEYNESKGENVYDRLMA